MNKILVELEADKLRELVETKTFNTKDGEVTKQVIKFDLIAKKLENQKTVYEGNNYQLVSTHFAVKPQTKEERESQADTVFLGGGISIVFDDAPQPVAAGVEESTLPF